MPVAADDDAVVVAVQVVDDETDVDAFAVLAYELELDCT